MEVHGVKLATTHFWDAHLKGDKAAGEYLGGDGLGKDTAKKAALERK